jgi:membrane protein
MAIAVWTLLKTTVSNYIDDNCLSRGAAIAYYTVFSMAPVLVIVIGVAGLFFGEAAAQGAIVGQLSGLMGTQSAEALQTMIKSASRPDAGILATVLGFGTLVITATGVFSEMQSALNAIWSAQPTGTTIGRLVRVRLLSLGLVMSLGFLLLVSLVVSAALTALGTWLAAFLPETAFLLHFINVLISFLLIAVLFAAIYKVLPDKSVMWRDVGIGAVATALLFSVGKIAISLYIGSSQVASSYGAAGALVVILLWIYYSAQIFLLGAEFTKVYAASHGNQKALSREASLMR